MSEESSEHSPPPTAAEQAELKRRTNCFRQELRDLVKAGPSNPNSRFSCNEWADEYKQ
jgi:hypothetical protein